MHSICWRIVGNITNWKCAHQKQTQRDLLQVQISSGVHPASCTMGTGSFPGVKRPGRDADHTPPSSAEVKKELSYTSTYPMGPPGPVTVFPFTNTPVLGAFLSYIDRQFRFNTYVGHLWSKKAFFGIDNDNALVLSRDLLPH
jgi:hypothetical protein